MVAIKEVGEKDDVVIVTTNGIVNRQPASEIRLAGRNTQGVRLIKLTEGDKVSDVAAVPSEEDETTNGGDKPEAPTEPDNQENLFPKGDDEKKSLKVKDEDLKKGKMKNEKGKVNGAAEKNKDEAREEAQLKAVDAKKKIVEKKPEPKKLEKKTEKKTNKPVVKKPSAKVKTEKKKVVKGKKK
jgi:DNA gyrase/topoisomerase IV subunit A